MDRRVGQHQPDQRAAGCDGVGDRRIPTTPQQHDRPGRTREHRGFGVVDVCVAARDVEIPHQHGQWLGAPRFPGPQRSDHRLVVDPTGQVIAADALDRDHGARGQCLLGGPQRGIGSVDPVGVRGEPQRRPAVRASDRLRVEAAIGRVVVFGGAALAHGERRHGGGRTVVGQGTDDGEPRTAVSARHEGVPVTAVVRVEQLGDAVVADGDVGRNRGSGTGDRLAVDDAKAAVAHAVGADIDDVDSTDRCQRRRLSAQPATEFVDARGRSLHFEEDRARIVADESGKPKLAGDPVDERAEPHPLDDTGHGEPLSDVDGLHQRVSHIDHPPSARRQRFPPDRRGPGPSTPDRPSPARRRPGRSSRRRNPCE